MPNTFTLIASSTAGAGGTAAFNFTSIPSTFTDLCIITSLRSERTTGGTDNLRLEINSSSGNFSYIYLEGTGSAATSGSDTTNIVGYLTQDGGTVGWTANTFTSTSIYIPNYAGSNNKSISVDTVTENSAVLAYSYLFASLWSQTAAITSLTLKTGSGSDLTQYSTAYLYGIVKS